MVKNTIKKYSKRNNEKCFLYMLEMRTCYSMRVAVSVDMMIFRYTAVLFVL